jgi:phage protein D/phage baseplate assembly protein gpV
MSISSTVLVEIDGRPLPEDVAGLLTSFLVDDSQRLPDLFVLRFRDPGRVVISKSGAKVGSTVKISVLTADSQTPAELINGEITALEAEFDSTGTFTLIRGYDPAHRLFRGRRTASYVQATASDIATTIARRAGLAVGQVTSTTTVYPQFSQAGETDWEVLERLARDTGFEVAVRDQKFTFGPPTPAGEAPGASADASANPLVLQLGKDLLSFRSVISSAEQVKEVEVRGWDIATKKALRANAPAKTASAELAAVRPVDLAHAFGDPTHVAASVPYRSQAEVDTAAKAMAEEIAGTFAEFEATARGNPELRAGTAIRIDQLGDPFDGKYVLTRSRHQFDPATGYTTAFTVSGRQDRSLLGLTGGRSRVPQAPPGVVVGVVSDIQDPENAARVRLTFPWLSDDYVSDWARTVQPSAGANRGWTVLPEVGDEVLVSFEQGDFGRPYVIGGLFNGVDTPPSGPVDLLDSGSGTANRRSMVSRKGHRMDLLDSDHSEGIRMATADDKLLIFVDSSQTTITVHADGKVAIEGSKGISIDAATSSLELKGGDISVKATNGVSIDGGPTLKLTGVSSKLEGSATTEVKGGSLCSVSGAMVKIN